MAGAVLLAVLAFLAWQASLAPVGTAPIRGGVPDSPAPPLEPSTVALEVAVPLSVLQARIAERIPDVLVDETGKEAKAGFRMDLRVSRTGVPTIAEAAGLLQITLPLTIDAKLYRGKRADRRAKRDKEAPRGMTVDAALALSVGLDLTVEDPWVLGGDATIRTVWTDDPVLQVGPVKVPVRKAIDKALAKKLPEIEQRVEARLRETSTLRTALTRAWTDLSTPRPLPEGGWLHLSPTSLALGDLTVREGALRVPVGLAAQVRVVPEEPPGVVAPLPDPGSPVDASGLRVAARVALAWEDLAERIGDRVVGTTVESAVGTLAIDEVRVYPSGGRVAVGLSVRAVALGATETGWLWVLAHPALQEADLVLDALDFVVESQGSWADTANHSTLRAAALSAVGPELRIPTRELTGDVLTKLRQRKRERGPELTWSSLEVVGLRMTEAALVVDARVVGTATMVVRD